MTKRLRGKSNVDKLLRAVDTPLFLLSPQRQVTLFNAGCERLTGWDAASVVGRTCDYASHGESSEVEALAAALCPPPEVMTGREAGVPAYVPRRGGEPLARLVRFIPLSGADGAVEAILGVISPIEPPARPAEAPLSHQLHAELAALRISLRQRFGLKSLVAVSPEMQRVVEQASLARNSQAAVLLLGEAGAGKEHLARLIHYESEARHRSFMPLDCRRLSALEMKQALRRFFESSRVEDESTGAGTATLKPGTVYLSHVELCPRDLQEMLVEAFGPNRPERRTDLRLMAASTSDLAAAVASETLRPDFYYLVTALCIELPPLRRRGEDLSLLAQSLLEDLNRGDEKQIGGFADDVWRSLREYNWPGNVDELAAVVAEARAACTDELIRAKDLPFRFRSGLEAQSVGPAIAPRVEALEPLLARIEKEQIEKALVLSRHNKSRAAELLGLTRPRLYRRMEALGIVDREEINREEGAE